MVSEEEIRVAKKANSIARWLPKRLVRAGTVLLRHVMVRLSEPVEKYGFQIIDMGDETGSEGRRQRVGTALALLKRLDPRRFERIKRDSSRIAIFHTVGTAGEHWTSPWLIVLNTSFVTDAPAEEIALVIVHEATHARLSKARIGYGEQIRHRVEKACVGEEKAFARRLPNSEEWVEYVGRKSPHPEYWTNAAQSVRREKAFEDLIAPPGHGS